MNIKGLDQLFKHVPALNSPPGVLRIFSLAILLFLLVTAFFNSATLLQSVWLLVGSIVFEGMAFLLLYQFFRYKDNFKARFGPLAYSQAVSRFGYPGVAIISAVVARILYLPGPDILPGRSEFVLKVLGWILVVIGLLLFLRILQVFGVDNLTMLYVYFPEESRLVDYRIYTIIRHPAYSAAQQIAYGLALLNGNWVALACAVIFTFGVWGWVRLVEEKELIQRFGQAYSEYRQRVPAFWPQWSKLGSYFNFLATGG